MAVPSGDKAAAKAQEKQEAEGEKEELVLQDTFAQETAVTVEDPNMYVASFQWPAFGSSNPICYISSSSLRLK